MRGAAFVHALLLLTLAAAGPARAEFDPPATEECDEHAEDCCPLPRMPSIDWDFDDWFDCWDELPVVGGGADPP